MELSRVDIGVFSSSELDCPGLEGLGPSVTALRVFCGQSLDVGNPHVWDLATSSLEGIV